MMRRHAESLAHPPLPSASSQNVSARGSVKGSSRNVFAKAGEAVVANQRLDHAATDMHMHEQAGGGTVNPVGGGGGAAPMSAREAAKQKALGSKQKAHEKGRARTESQGFKSAGIRDVTDVDELTGHLRQGVEMTEQAI